MTRDKLYRMVVQYCCNICKPWAVGLGGRIDNAYIDTFFQMDRGSNGKMAFADRKIDLYADSSCFIFTDFYESIDGGTTLYIVQESGDNVRITEYLNIISMREMGRKIQFNPILKDRLVVVAWRKIDDEYSVAIVDVTERFSKEFCFTVER